MSLQSVEYAVRQNYTHGGRKKIPELTGIRGIAACWVVLFHFIALPPRIAQLSVFHNLPVISKGYLGVDLFFILSGFVLYLTYSVMLEKPNFSEIRKFFISRIFRIFPLNWVALAVFGLLFLTAGVKMFRPELGPYNAKTFFLAVFLVQSWVQLPKVWNLPSWSLSNEFLAYILFPILVLGFARIRHWWLALALALGAFAAFGFACALSRDPGLDHIIRLGLIRCLLEFPAGMLLCRMLQLQTFTRRDATVFCMLGLALLALATVNIRLDVLALPAFSLMIVSCAIGCPLTLMLFGNRICHWLGEISFSIYLTHFIFLGSASRICEIYFPGSASARLGVFGIAIVAVLPVAYLTWRCVEVPGQVYGRILMGNTLAAPTQEKSVTAG